MQAPAQQQSANKSNTSKAAKQVRAARQPTSPVAEEQNPDARKKTTRGLVARPSPNSTSTPQPPGGLPKDTDAEQSMDKHNIGRAISRGRSGVNDIQGLLTRQPSVHPPVRNHPSSGIQQQLEGLKELTAAPVMASPFAATAAGKVDKDLPAQGHNPQLTPSLIVGTASSAGTAGSAGTTALSTGLSVSASAAKREAGKHEGYSRPPSGLQGHVAKAAAAEGLLHADSSLGLARASPTSRAESISLASSDDQAPASASAQAPLSEAPQIQAHSAPDPTNFSWAAVGADIQALNAQPGAHVTTSPKPPDHSPSLQLSLADSASDKDAAGDSSSESGSSSANDAAQGSGLLPRIRCGPEVANMQPVKRSSIRSLQALNETDHSSLPAVHGADALQLIDQQQSVHSSRSNSHTGRQQSRQSSRSDSYAGRTRSVTFGGATPLLPHGHKQQSFLGREARSDSRQSSASLVRLSSSLAAAMSETMQDRMLAGGMMHWNPDIGHDDRYSWSRTPSSLSVREGSSMSDRCLGLRRILKHSATEQPSHQESSGTVANGNAARDSQSRRSMPLQLARHQSSLNQVSRRPDLLLP